jgi:hypothetical protein
MLSSLRSAKKETSGLDFAIFPALNLAFARVYFQDIRARKTTMGCG